MDKNILQKFPLEERSAFIGSIASIASLDRIVDEHEEQAISDLCEDANLSTTEKETIINAARDGKNADLVSYLTRLKNSDLRFSLLTELIAFASHDGKIDKDELERISNIAKFLEINKDQVEALKALVEEAQISAISNKDNVVTSNGVLNSRPRIGEKLTHAGLGGALSKGLLGLFAFGAMSGLMRGRRRMMGPGLLGGGFGGPLGGFGMGSIFNFLGGRPGLTGGLLGNLTGRGRW